MADVKEPIDIASSPRRSAEGASPEKNLDADEIRLAQMGKFDLQQHSLWVLSD